MKPLDTLIKKSHIKYTSPSNIAFVKYWGKRDRQIPMNPSLSMTLKRCVSTTEIAFEYSDKFSLDSFVFEGEENEIFRAKTEKFLISILNELPFLNSYKIKIESENSFPHSSGIASSASGFSAIIMCLLRFKSKLEKTKIDLELASHLARLGSGSACRSIFGGFAHWGESSIENSSNEFAKEISFPLELKNCIAIVSKSKKSVPSSHGHSLMNTNPYADQRYINAKENLSQLIQLLSLGNWDEAGIIIEEEALSLHALMMVSKPSFVLLEPNSLAIIKAIRDFRNTTGEPVYFTIDAGPNIHILYPCENSQRVEKFIDEELTPLVSSFIFDHIGSGPSLISENYFE